MSTTILNDVFWISCYSGAFANAYRNFTHYRMMDAHQKQSILSLCAACVLAPLGVWETFFHCPSRCAGRSIYFILPCRHLSRPTVLSTIFYAARRLAPSWDDRGLRRLLSLAPSTAQLLSGHDCRGAEHHPFFIASVPWPLAGRVVQETFVLSSIHPVPGDFVWMECDAGLPSR